MTTWDANATAAVVLLAFGIVVPVPAFGAGMLLAVGCCYGVRAFRSVDGRKGIGLSLFCAVLAATIVAGLKDHTTGLWVWGSLPVQFQMALAGTFSQALFEVVAARDTKLAEKIADWAGLRKGRK